MFSELLVLSTALTCQQVAPPQTYEPKFLDRINLVRKTVGLPPITIDPDLTKGCRSHGQYLAKNLEHPTTLKRGYAYEDPMLPGYTAEGAHTARSSIAYTWQGESPLATMDWLLATHFGRCLLFNPDLVKMGIGISIVTTRPLKWVSVIDLNRGFKGEQPVFYPGDKQTNVPRAFTGPEQPGPIPVEQQKTAGFPVTASFPLGASVRNVKATLSDAAGKEVDVHLTTPQKSPLPEELQRNTVCLIPKEALAPSMMYSVSITAEVADKPFKHAWSFTTGEALKVKPDPAATVADKVNAHRKLAGLDPVTEDVALSKGCASHAKYVVLNIDNPILKKEGGVHDEDPKLPGYTPEGKKAAKGSHVYLSEPLPLMDTFMGMFLPRVTLLDPYLRRIGVGSEKSEKGFAVSVIDVSNGRGAGGFDRVIVYPGDKQKGVPHTYGVELPDPIPQAADKSKAGFPVTAMFPLGANITEATAKLTLGGKEVPAWISTPEMPVNGATFQRNTILLITREPLRLNGTYTATFSAKIDGKPWSKTWTFTTAFKPLN